MKKTYEPETKSAIEQVIDVFNDYIRTSTHFELLWSDKVGYIYISIDNVQGSIGDTGCCVVNCGEELRLLGTQTALDELGIGTVRDAFSDMLFPGISTLQTRAKYFVILPYLFAKAENRRFMHRRDIIAYIHNEEFALVKTLVKNSGPEAYGIVGSRNMEKMVKMKPSSIYWNGLRTVGILRYPNISLDEACEIVLRNERIKSEVTLKTESADEAADDTDALAGKTVLFSPIVPDYDVQKDATIELTKKEAQYLYDHFLDSPATCNSLTAYMLREKIRFPSFWEIPYATIPSDISDAVHLAQEFAEFIYGAHLLYNIIYADGCGIHDDEVEAIRAEFKGYCDHYHSIHLEDVLAISKCPPMTSQFLRAFDTALQEGDIDAARDLLIRRERFVKQNRAKLNNPKSYRFERPIHYYKLDYRFGTASTIINDILTGLEA